MKDSEWICKYSRTGRKWANQAPCLSAVLFRKEHSSWRASSKGEQRLDVWQAWKLSHLKNATHHTTSSLTNVSWTLAITIALTFLEAKLHLHGSMQVHKDYLFPLKHITRPALGILPELILQSIFKCTVSIKLRFHYKWNITTRCHQNNDHPHLEETKNLLIHTITIHY